MLQTCTLDTIAYSALLFTLFFSKKGRKLWVRKFVAIISIILLTMLLIGNKATPALGHPITVGVVSPYFRINDEQFSANNVTVGDTFEVKLELKSLINRNITITPLLLAGRTPRAPDNNLGFIPINSSMWKIENATFTGKFLLGPGETQPFSVNVTALEPGDYTLHSAFA